MFRENLSEVCTGMIVDQGLQQVVEDVWKAVREFIVSLKVFSGAYSYEGFSGADSYELPFDGALVRSLVDVHST